MSSFWRDRSAKPFLVGIMCGRIKAEQQKLNTQLKLMSLKLIRSTDMDLCLTIACVRDYSSVKTRLCRPVHHWKYRHFQEMEEHQS
jgi:hypothetical protein